MLLVLANSDDTFDEMYNVLGIKNQIYMNGEDLRLLLPIVLTVYLALIFIWGVYRNRKPVLIKGDVNRRILRRWYGIRLLTTIFRWLLMLATFIVLAFSYWPDLYNRFYPIHSLDRLDVNMLGFTVLLFSILWMLVAQLQLSKKIGKGTASGSCHGLEDIFSFEENILLGILIMICGVFVTISSLLALVVSLTGTCIYLFYYFNSYGRIS